MINVSCAIYSWISFEIKIQQFQAASRIELSVSSVHLVENVAIFRLNWHPVMTHEYINFLVQWDKVRELWMNFIDFFTLANCCFRPEKCDLPKKNIHFVSIYYFKHLNLKIHVEVLKITVKDLSKWKKKTFFFKINCFCFWNIFHHSKIK